MVEQPKLRKHELVQVGDVFTTTNDGSCEVVSLDGVGTSRSIALVRFITTGGLAKCRVSELRRGHIKDRNKPTVFGLGYVGFGEYTATHPAYNTWYAMMSRCYGSSSNSYQDTQVCDEWHNYQAFAKFYEDNYVDGYQLDKDIVSPGCKVYSPSTCLFVPRTVNNAEAILRCLVNEDPTYQSVLDFFNAVTITRHK